MVIFRCVFDLRRHVGAIDAGYGGFEVDLGLIQEPEVVEEPPEPEELPEEPGIEPVPRSQPTRVVTTVTETAVQEAAPSSEQLTLEVDHVLRFQHHNRSHRPVGVKAQPTEEHLACRTLHRTTVRPTQSIQVLSYSIASTRGRRRTRIGVGD